MQFEADLSHAAKRFGRQQAEEDDIGDQLENEGDEAALSGDVGVS